MEEKKSGERMNTKAPRVVIKKLSDLAKQFLKSDIVIRFCKKHPTTFHFLVKRLSLKSFIGLPFTILIISIFFNLLLLFNFTSQTINSKEMVAVDNFIALSLFNLRSAFLANVLYYFSQVCNSLVVGILGAVLAIYFFSQSKPYFAMGIIITLLGSGISIFLGKGIFEVSRPDQYAFYQENRFSFPSGHSTIAVAFYGLLFYFFVRNATSFKKWSLIISLAIAFFILIGFSRLYLCVHYFSDVVAGYLLGFLWLLMSISIIEWLENKIKKTYKR
jgi:membrane-associated phospholipid phosphatase